MRNVNRFVLNTGLLLAKTISSWSENLSEISQASVLGPLLFGAYYLSNLVYLVEKTDICNFGDDKTFHACKSVLNFLFKRL